MYKYGLILFLIPTLTFAEGSLLHLDRVMLQLSKPMINESFAFKNKKNITHSNSESVKKESSTPLDKSEKIIATESKKEV